MAADLVVRRGWRLIEMRSVGMTLEQIFLKVVAGEIGGKAAPVPAEPEAAEPAPVAAEN